MKRLMTILVATAFAAACAVEAGTQEEVEAETAAYEFEVPVDVVVSPEGPGSCTGWASEAHPGFVVIPAECLASVRYYYMGDPWVVQDGELGPESQVE